MAENFDLNNLMLDANEFTVVPEGDYHFTVDGYEMDYANSDKFPEDTQVIRVLISVPVMIDGKRETASIRRDLPVCTKMLFLIRQFFECIGMLPEHGRQKMPSLELIKGKTGVFRLIQGVSAKGNAYNSVDKFYAPSKAPTICDNDDAWKVKDTPNMPLPEGFQVDEAEVNPFV